MRETEASHLVDLRLNMVDEIAQHAIVSSQRTGKEVLDERVMDAMRKVPRHKFVPAEVRNYAYFDTPLPIGSGKTISQPFMAAVMTDLMEIQPSDTILEIGTGLGYHTAILAELAVLVYSIEIIEELGELAADQLGELGYDNVQARIGDGNSGWPEHAPFDKMLVAAAPPSVPDFLLQQLKVGGRMIIPVGPESAQELVVVEKGENNVCEARNIFPVRFAPMVTSH